MTPEIQGDPIHASTPPAVEEIREDPKNDSAADEPVDKTQANVVVTSECHDPALEASAALAKIIDQNELPSKQKGKGSLHFNLLKI